jgi:hypothetical protein
VLFHCKPQRKYKERLDEYKWHINRCQLDDLYVWEEIKWGAEG